MEELSSEQCVAAIEAERPLRAAVDGGAFFLHIAHYTHFVCTAIHHGHRMRPEVAAKCALDEAARRYEEDPYTGDIIHHLPITVVGGDSRFEYDLNRPPEACIHEEAWGRRVWSTPLSDEDRARSLARHQAFYRVLGALYRKLEQLHPAVLVYDVHSYNHRRPGMQENTPVFNVGTEQLDTARWGWAIDDWLRQLDRIRLPGIQVRAALNEVYYGRGYQATFVRDHFPDTLILPTELKKVFMDEFSGQLISPVFEALRAAFREAVIHHATAFREGLSRPSRP